MRVTITPYHLTSFPRLPGARAVHAQRVPGRAHVRPAVPAAHERRQRQPGRRHGHCRQGTVLVSLDHRAEKDREDKL